MEDALDEYEGSVLLVSHDCAFLREVATWFGGSTSSAPGMRWRAELRADEPMSMSPAPSSGSS
jgi:ATP-binding cassette subfamily F protein 3